MTKYHTNVGGLAKYWRQCFSLFLNEIQKDTKSSFQVCQIKY